MSMDNPPEPIPKPEFGQGRLIRIQFPRGITGEEAARIIIEAHGQHASKAETELDARVDEEGFHTVDILGYLATSPGCNGCNREIDPVAGVATEKGG